MKNIPIEELQLSFRTIKKLRKNGITTVHQLISKTETQLWNECALGRSSMDEILIQVRAHGFELKSEGDVLFMVMD